MTATTPSPASARRFPFERVAGRRASKIVIDVSLLVGFIAEFLTREGPDYAVHSWIGIVLVPVITVHLLGNGAWIRRLLAKRRSDAEFSLAVLNAGLGTLSVVCIITGFPLWFEWIEGGVTAGVHTITGFLAILVMFVHLWRNRRRIGLLIRR